jgi:hypothetical protein
MTLQGYTVPRTPEGKASLVPAPPWHYVGDFLVVDFHADPDAAASLLPGGIEPHPDAGRCAAVFVDWQSYSEGGDELTDPDSLSCSSATVARASSRPPATSCRSPASSAARAR